MNFLWGTATSSHQIEGNNIHNDWWQWEMDGNVEGGVTSGRATDHWTHFKQDLELARGLGNNSYRFSVEWSRVEPEEGRWDREALQWYENLIGECERRQLLPMLTLHHFTIPQWVADRGGLTWEHFPGRFAGFLKKLVSAFGGRVPLWCTLNEPNNLAIGAYLGGYMPPARNDAAAAGLASRNLFRAHILAYDLIHSLVTERSGPWKQRPLEVGLALNLIDFQPLRVWHPVELGASKLFKMFYNLSWPDAVTGKKQHFGAPGFVPFAAQVPQARGRRTCDFLGINYYTKVYVACRPLMNKGRSEIQDAFPTSSRLPIGIAFSRAGDVCSDLGWVNHPSGLRERIRLMKGYQLPLYVTENGIADATDRLRPAHLTDHLKEIARAIEEGADIRGYYHWSLIDNFEWIKGFWPRFGLFEIDYNTMERKERPSARLYREIIAAHELARPNSKILANF